MARSLRKKGDLAPRGEHPSAVCERAEVARHVRAGVLAPVNGQRSRQGKEGAHHGVREESALSQHPGTRAGQSKKKHRVHHGVVVVGHEKEGNATGNALTPTDLHLAKEDVQHESGQARDTFIHDAPEPSRRARKSGRSGALHFLAPRAEGADFTRWVNRFPDCAAGVGQDQENRARREERDQGQHGLTVGVGGSNHEAEDQGAHPGRAAVGDLIDPEEGGFAVGRDHAREQRPGEGLGTAQHDGNDGRHPPGLGLGLKDPVSVDDHARPDRERKEEGVFCSGNDRDALEEERPAEAHELDHQYQTQQEGLVHLPAPGHEELLGKKHRSHGDDRLNAVVKEQIGNEVAPRPRKPAQLPERAPELRETHGQIAPPLRPGFRRLPRSQATEGHEGEADPPEAGREQAEAHRTTHGDAQVLGKVHEDQVGGEEEPAPEVAEGIATARDPVALVRGHDLG